MEIGAILGLNDLKAKRGRPARLACCRFCPDTAAGAALLTAGSRINPQRGHQA
jgi:hypothetical protein